MLPCFQNFCDVGVQLGMIQQKMHRVLNTFDSNSYGYVVVSVEQKFKIRTEIYRWRYEASTNREVIPLTTNHIKLEFYKMNLKSKMFYFMNFENFNVEKRLLHF